MKQIQDEAQSFMNRTGINLTARNVDNKTLYFFYVIGQRHMTVPLPLNENSLEQLSICLKVIEYDMTGVK